MRNRRDSDSGFLDKVVKRPGWVVVTVSIVSAAAGYFLPREDLAFVILLWFFGIIIELLLHSFRKTSESVGEHAEEIANRIAECMGDENHPGKLVKTIGDALQLFSIRKPVHLARGYERIIQTIFEIPDPEMQHGVVDFAFKVLDNIQRKNGFPLSDTDFPRYQELAQTFAKATRECLHMTCIYTPLYYFRQFASREPEDPKHLVTFNGTNISGVVTSSFDIDRVRLSFVGQRLAKEMGEFPAMSAVAIMWYFLLSAKFREMTWVNKEEDNDVIIADKKFMWRYVARARTLYLKCAWSEESDILTEWGKWFRDDDKGKTHCMKGEKILEQSIKNDGDGQPWKLFSTELSEYLTAVSKIDDVSILSDDGFTQYQALCTGVLKKVVSASKQGAELRLFEWVKAIYQRLTEEDCAKLDGFIAAFARETNATKPFLAHIRVIDRLEAERARLVKAKLSIHVS